MLATDTDGSARCGASPVPVNLLRELTTAPAKAREETKNHIKFASAQHVATCHFWGQRIIGDPMPGYVGFHVPAIAPRHACRAFVPRARRYRSGGAPHARLNALLKANADP